MLKLFLDGGGVRHQPQGRHGEAGHHIAGPEYHKLAVFGWSREEGWGYTSLMLQILDLSSKENFSEWLALIQPNRLFRPHTTARTPWFHTWLLIYYACHVLLIPQMALDLLCIHAYRMLLIL
jgi:hypothetical protein